MNARKAKARKMRLQWGTRKFPDGFSGFVHNRRLRNRPRDRYYIIIEGEATTPTWVDQIEGMRARGWDCGYYENFRFIMSPELPTP